MCDKYSSETSVELLTPYSTKISYGYEFCNFKLKKRKLLRVPANQQSTHRSPKPRDFNDLLFT